MPKKPVKKRHTLPALVFTSPSDEEAPSPSIFPLKIVSASSTAAVLRKHPDPSLKPADGEQEEEESSEDSENAARKRKHGAAPRVSRNTDNANDLKLEKPSAAIKTLARAVSMANKPKEDDESSESEESSEDSGNAVREPNSQTRRRDSQTADDGKHELSNTSSSSDSGAEVGEEDSEELNSRSTSEQLLPPAPPQPASNAVNPIADPLLKIPNSAKSVDGGEEEKGLESEEESTADESSEGFGNTAAKENTGPQPRDSQNLDDDKQASDTSSSSGSGLGNDEEAIETPISGPLLEPLSCKPIDSSVQPVKKKPNSKKQSAASTAQISKKKRTAGIIGVEGGQEKERFRRIWSDEDELALLQGIMEYKKQHCIIPYSHMHAESLLNSVKDSLSISVSVNQINDKVRRLKRRYTNTSMRQNLAKRSKISDPHNAAVFDLSKKIWDSLKEESILLEKKITPEKKEENSNKKKVGLKHFAEEYPSLYWHLRSEHVNSALALQNHIPIANAKKWEKTCKKLEMIDVELNMQKVEFLSSAVKLIKDALASC